MNVLEKLIQQFVRSRNWAIVGASNDTSKYGNVIFNVMKGSGYNGKRNKVLIFEY